MLLDGVNGGAFPAVALSVCAEELFELWLTELAVGVESDGGLRLVFVCFLMLLVGWFLGCLVRNSSHSRCRSS
jgi:hypothetical protein